MYSRSKFPKSIFLFRNEVDISVQKLSHYLHSETKSLPNYTVGMALKLRKKIVAIVFTILQ